MSSRSHGETRPSCSSSVGSGAPRSSCMITQRFCELTRTSVQPACLWRYESLPGWSTSKLWCACLISETTRPFLTRRGTICSMRVVLPLPDQPVMPKIFIAPFYQGRRSRADIAPEKARACPASRPRLVRVGEEQLLPADLVSRDDLLALGRDQPVDELLAEVLLHVRVLLRVHQHHAVLVEQALVALHDDLEIAAVLERDPRAAIRQDVGPERRRGVERRAHALPRVLVPGALVPGDVDVRVLPQRELG